MPDDMSVVPFVWMYHSVAHRDLDPDLVTVSPARFEQQMAWLKRRGLRGVCMRHLLEAARRGSTAGLVGLTFDDGYADFTTHVAPVLARYGFTATTFVVAGKLGGKNEWDVGSNKALMTPEEVREAARLGLEIGSHGLDHRSLAHAEPDALVYELEHSREILEALLEEPVRGFAYPYGAVSRSAARVARAAGYDYAVATWQHARRDRYAMPRTYVGDRDGASRLYAKQVRHRLKWGRA